MSSSLPPILLPTGRQRPIFTVREVESGWERRQFAGTAAHVYSQDRYWVPLLARERRRSLEPEHNPDLGNLDPGLFLAEARNPAWADTPAGSLAVWFDPAAGHPGGGIIASFGMFEASNEPEIAERLFDVAEMWLYQHVPGLAAIRGPMSLEPLRPPGLIVDGFDARPAAYLPYNPPYYNEMIESAGYHPALEWQSYTLALDELPAAYAGTKVGAGFPRPDPPREPGQGDPAPTANVGIIRGAELADHALRLMALLEAAAEPEGAADDDQPEESASPFARMPIYPIMRDLQEPVPEAWDDEEPLEFAQDDDESALEDDIADGWKPGPEDLMPGLADALALFSGELTTSRFGREGRLALRWLLPRSLAAVAQSGGEDVAAALALPDVSRGLRQSGGRLLPFGWLPYQLAATRTKELRVLPVILHPEWEEEGAQAALYASLALAAHEEGYRTVEFGPILSEDAASIEGLLEMGARRSRTYQVYQKDL